MHLELIVYKMFNVLNNEGNNYSLLEGEYRITLILKM